MRDIAHSGRNFFSVRFLETVYCNAVVTRVVKLYQPIRRLPSARILFQRAETCLKLFQNYFSGLLLQLSSLYSNMFNVAEIILKTFQDSFSGSNNFLFQFQTRLRVKYIHLYSP